MIDGWHTLMKDTSVKVNDIVLFWLYTRVTYFIVYYHHMLTPTTSEFVWSREDCISVSYLHNRGLLIKSVRWPSASTDNGLWLTVANGGLSALACGGYIGCKQETLYLSWVWMLRWLTCNFFFAYFFLPSPCFVRDVWFRSRVIEGWRGVVRSMPMCIYAVGVYT